MCGPEWGNGGEKVEGEGDATDRKFSTVNGIALRLAPLLSRYFGLDAMSELMVYNPWCESEIYEREVGWYIYIYRSAREGVLCIGSLPRTLIRLSCKGCCEKKGAKPSTTLRRERF